MGAGRERVVRFGDLLRQVRLASGLTQDELARRSGVSVRSISDLERGRTSRPQPRSASLLAGALDLNPSVRNRLLHAARRGVSHPAGARAVDTAGASARATPLQRLAPPVPAQLPADVSDFTGREEQADRLCERLTRAVCAGSPGAIVVSAVVGQGGIGKTSLAIHVAQRVAGAFPDGNLYVNLRAASGEPLAPTDVLARFLRDLGVDPAAISGAEQECAAAYRSAVAGRRMLIVLDDACDAAQVRPLLPGRAGCAVLVTSRSWLTDLDGAVPLQLDVLPWPQAHALFTRVVGERRVASEPGAVAAILKACAGLPLAIRIAAARLASRPSWRIHDLAERLADERRRLDELTVGERALRASFEVSYAALPPPRGEGGTDAARAFRLLSLWPGKDLTTLAAAAMLGRAREHADRELDVLLGAHLLGSRSQGRFRFHDLLRVFAAERACEQETSHARDDAMRRLLTWYLHAVATAGRMLVPARRLPALAAPCGLGELPSFGTYAEAIGWYDGEFANLVTATSAAARRGLDEIACKLPVMAWGFFDLRKHRVEWINTHRIALLCARRLRDRFAEAVVLANLGMAHGQQLQAEKALRCLGQALTLHRVIGDRYGEGSTLSNLGLVAHGLGRYEDSITWLSQALPIRRQAGDRSGEAVTLGNLGEAYRRMRAFDDAVEHLERALSICREVGDSRYEANVLGGMAAVCTDLDNLDQAIRYCQQSLAIRQEIGDPCGVAVSLDQIAHTLRRAGLPELARRSWEQALALYREVGHPKAASVQRCLDQMSRVKRLVPLTSGMPPAMAAMTSQARTMAG